MIVSLEGVVRDPFSASVLVRFVGPFVTVFGPRPNVGDTFFRPTCPDPFQFCSLCQGNTVFIAPRTPTFPTLNIFGQPFTSFNQPFSPFTMH